MSTATRSVRLVLDFDGTLTKKDTIYLVAKAGYDHQKSLQKQPPTPWTKIVRAYLSDYSLHESEYRPEKQSRKTLVEEVMWLNSLKPIENTSVRRLHDAGIFDDVTKKDMADAANEAVRGGEVQLRPGWSDLINQVYKMNKSSTFKEVEPVEILSVNWSRWFIWSTLLANVQDTRSEMISNFFADKSKSINIFANEVPTIADESSPPTSEYIPGGQPTEMRTSGDKLATLLENNKTLLSLDTKLLCLYIGDSTTDLECLIAADVGICIRDEPMGSGQQELADCCERIGICVKHISFCNSLTDSIGAEATETTDPVLWWASDFAEISTWLTEISTSLLTEQ